MLLKTLHMTLAYVTVAGFLLRFGLAVVGHRWRDARFTRIAPHVIDTALLTLGVVMAVRYGLSPVSGWLGAKLLGLLGYILFGVLAMRGRGVLRWFGASAAIGCVAYIFAVAFSREPWPFS